MTDFYRLVEHNDNEGETWLFYFKADAKVVEALDTVSTFIDGFEFESDLTLDEEDVDFIVDHLDGLGSYKSLANKVTLHPGKAKELIDLASKLNAAENNDDDDLVDELCEEISGILYKGSLFDE